jgi:hypothetical protein
VARGKLFGDRPVGAVTIVETPIAQWYVQRARVAFLVVGAVSGVVTAAVVAVFAPLVLAVVLGVLAGVVCGMVAAVLARVWPVLRVLWWWSLEITVAGMLVAGPSWLARATGAWLALVVVVLVAGLCVLVHPVRRWLSAWSWCVVVRHRLRLCFATMIRSAVRVGGMRPPALPLLLWARPTPAGERVWLWLRPGLSLEDLEDKAPLIAVACIAKQVRILPASERYAALLRVDIARRDPLAGEVASPLALLIPSLRKSDEKRENDERADVPVSPVVPPVGLDLADIEEPAVPDSRGGRR